MLLAASSYRVAPSLRRISISSLAATASLSPPSQTRRHVHGIGLAPSLSHQVVPDGSAHFLLRAQAKPRDNAVP